MSKDPCPYCGSTYFPGMSIIGHLVAHAHRETKVSPREICGAGRAIHVAHIRFAIMAVARRRGLSLTQIGRGLGKRDHTTIMNGLKRAEELSAQPEFRGLMMSLESS